MMTGLDCGHTYCSSCWTEYLMSKIEDGGANKAIECPGECDRMVSIDIEISPQLHCSIYYRKLVLYFYDISFPVQVEDTTVMDLLKDPSVKVKYQYLITSSFVQVRDTC